MPWCLRERAHGADQRRLLRRFEFRKLRQTAGRLRRWQTAEDRLNDRPSGFRESRAKIMLAEKDKVFTNLYGFHDWKLEGARQRGVWSNTKDLVGLGRGKIIAEVRDSG